MIDTTLVQFRQDLVPMIKEMGLPLVVAEVGTAEGLFSKEMLDAGVEQLYLIDLWAHQPGITGDGGSPQEWHDKNLGDLIQRLLPYRDKIKFIRNYSHSAAENIPDESLGMAYIDCNHAYEFVKRDNEAYLPKVVPGGIVAFHDYLNQSYGVKRAVDEFCAATGRKVNLIPDKDYWHAGAWYIK